MVGLFNEQKNFSFEDSGKSLEETSNWKRIQISIQILMSSSLIPKIPPVIIRHYYILFMTAM